MLSAGERPTITMKLPAGVFSSPTENGPAPFVDEQVGEQIYKNGLEKSFGAKEFGKSTMMDGSKNVLYTADAGLCAVYSQAEGQRLVQQGVSGEEVEGFIGLSRFCLTAADVDPQTREERLERLDAIEKVNGMMLGSASDVAAVHYENIYTFELALQHIHALICDGNEGQDEGVLEFTRGIPMLRNEAYNRIVPELKTRGQLNEALHFIDQFYSSQSPIGNDWRKIAHGSIARLDVADSRKNLYSAMYGNAGSPRDTQKVLIALESLHASFERAKQLHVPVELGNNADLLWMARTFRSQEAFQLIDQYFASNPEKNIGVETVASLGN